MLSRIADESRKDETEMLTPETRVFCAVAGHRDCDVSIRVLGFDPVRVAAELVRHIETAKAYAAEQDGTRPEDIEMWMLGPLEHVLDDVSPSRNTFDWYDMQSGLEGPGIWVGGE